MGHTVHNKIDMVIDKSKVDVWMDKRGIGQYMDLWEKVLRRYSIGLNYKSFMNLLGNTVTWRLLYAYALTETLGVRIDDLFVMVDVRPSDVEATPEDDLALATQGAH